PIAWPCIRIVDAIAGAFFLFTPNTLPVDVTTCKQLPGVTRNKETIKTRRDIRRFKRFKNANHPHICTTRYKAASSAPSPRKQATTHKHAGSKATNPQTLFRALDRKSTRLNSSHVSISYAVFCLKKKTNI